MAIIKEQLVASLALFSMLDEDAQESTIFLFTSKISKESWDGNKLKKGQTSPIQKDIRSWVAGMSSFDGRRQVAPFTILVNYDDNIGQSKVCINCK